MVDQFALLFSLKYFKILFLHVVFRFRFAIWGKYLIGMLIKLLELYRLT